MLVQNLFERDIFRPINGVVKADQLDDSSVWQELDESVVTRELDQHFRKFISWYLEALDQEKMPNINFDGLQTAVAAIIPLLEDCCRYIGSHSQPMETLNVRPTLDTLKADWKRLLEARDAYVKKPTVN
jgi:hypothetical protein